MPTKIAILGGGIIGVSSAWKIVNSLPDVEVSLISEEWSPNTTGDGSAGFLMPYLTGKTSQHKISQWFKSTMDFAKEHCWSFSGGQFGVGLLSAYLLYEDEKERTIIEPFKNDFLRFHELTPKELKMFPSKFSGGAFLTTYFIECVKLLPILMDKFQAKGGKILQQKVKNIEELEDFDIIVNCTGLQAGRLFKDDKIKPIRGQVIRVSAPWIKHAIMTKNNYILPNSDVVILGGTKQEDDWNYQVDIKDRSLILDGCCSIFPSLKSAQVVKEWVGLRPGREEPRIEVEKVDKKNKNGTFHVIHNYGHGGCGVSLFWGCAEDVLRLAKQIIGSDSKAYNVSLSRL